jgi:hypothetical protein
MYLELVIIFSDNEDGEEIHNLHSSLNIIRVIKSRRMRWTRHVARIGEMRNVCEILVGKPEGKRPLGRPGMGGRIILKWVLGKLGLVVWIGFIQLRIETGCGLLWNTEINLQVQ